MGSTGDTAVTFGGYTFAFAVLTTGNVYAPARFDITETGDGVVARATALTYGEGSGTTDGLLEVTFRRRDGGLSWQARAAHAEPIKGIKATVWPLPLATVTVPPTTQFTLKPGEPGRGFVYPNGYYPLRHGSHTGITPASGPLPTWAAQFLLLRDAGRTLYLHTREYPPRVQKVWLYHRGSHLELRLYGEANASARGPEYTAPVWYLDEMAGWQQAVDDHVAWLTDAFGLRPFAERADAQPWLKDIALAAVLHGRGHDNRIGHDFDAMTRRLEELAARFPAPRILIKLVGFEGRIDHAWPDNAPDPVLGGAAAFARFMATARRHGFHIMPHLNVWGASLAHPLTPLYLPYQVQDAEGRPLGWGWDFDEDEIAEDIFAYISPDAPEWRALLRQKVRAMVARDGVDTIFLDQAGTYVNDARYNHFRGLRALYDELRADLPHIQFTGEGMTTEVSASLYPLLSGITGNGAGDEGAALFRRLFRPFVRQHGHSIALPPEPYRGVWFATPGDWWSRERYDAQQANAEAMGGIPTLNLTDRRIRLDGEGARSVFDYAHRYAQGGQDA